MIDALGRPAASTLVSFPRYGLISWLETFPILAYQSLLNDDLRMPLSMISSYYAVTFMPFMWKPLFGWVSDNLPIAGYHRSVARRRC